MRFPPVMSRAQLEKSGYLEELSQFAGLRVRFARLRGVDPLGCRALRQRRRLDHLARRSSDLVLSPAACYPVYPIAAARGTLPPGGLQFDIEADVFRHEPSRSLDRLQSFRMREFVQHRRARGNRRVSREMDGQSTACWRPNSALPLSRIDVANDPFFGRVGQVMAVSQRQQALKFELLIPYYPGASPTACMSFNYHREHFGQVWGIHDDRRRIGAHQLRRVRHRSPGRGAVRQSWPGSQEVAGGDPAGAGPVEPRARMPLDPRVKRFLDLLAAGNPPDARERHGRGTPRTGSSALMEFAGPPVGSRQVEDRTAAGRGRRRCEFGSIHLRRTRTSLPGLIYFHGGGLVAGSLDTHDCIGRALSHCRRVPRGLGGLSVGP